MLKKMVILGVIGFVAVSALGGTKLASYIRSEIREARERAENNIPPEKELARIRNEIKELDRDIVKVIGQLAEQNVAVDNQKAQNAETAKKQEATLKSLKLRGEALKAREEVIRNAQNGVTTPAGHVTFGNKTVNIADATKELDADKKALEQDANTYKKTQDLLVKDQATLATRIKVRDSVKQNLEAMQSQKGELTAAADELEAQLVALKAEQTRSKYQTDDTRLAKIKEDIRNLKTKLDVEKEKNRLMQGGANPAVKSESTKSVDDILGSLETKPEGEKTETKVPHVD